MRTTQVWRTIDELIASLMDERNAALQRVAQLERKHAKMLELEQEVLDILQTNINKADLWVSHAERCADAIDALRLRELRIWDPLARP